MKLNSMKAYSLLFFFSLFILAMGCKKDNNADKIITMTVASKKVVSFTSIAPITSLNVKIEGNSQGWFPLTNSEIQGFEYEEGFEYVLKVNQKHVENPPADGSSIEYVLIEVLSKTQDSVKP
jgi:hypothetical protein